MFALISEGWLVIPLAPLPVFLSATPGSSSCDQAPRAPASCASRGASHGSRAHSHDHLECLRWPGLRLPPCPGELFPGAGPGVPRLGAQSHTATPRRSKNCNHGSSCSPFRRTDPDAAGGSPWPPAGHSVTVSPRRRCWNVVVGVPSGVLEGAGSRQSIYSQATGTKPSQPLQAVSVCQRTFPMGIRSLSVHPCSPPGRLPPASLIPARLWF